MSDNYTIASARALADEFQRMAGNLPDGTAKDTFMDAADALLDAVDVLEEGEPT